MLIQIVSFPVLCYFHKNFYVLFFGSLCHCFMGLFCTTPWSIATLALRLNPLGRKCSYNTAFNDYDSGEGFERYYGDTYSDDASKLLGLAITGLILGVCQCTICQLPLLCTTVDNFESHKKAPRAAKKVELKDA